MLNNTKERSKIFFSWETDLPKSTNTNLIRSCIDKVKIDLVKKSVWIDRDEATRDVPGAPKIIDEIIKKIQEADIFICDLTTINSECCCLSAWQTDERVRRTPNPNVLIELGFAIGILGWERVIVLFNTIYGSFKDDLPFDIDKRRVTTYTCSEDTIKEGIDTLSRVLKLAIYTILQNNPVKPVLTPKLKREYTAHERDLKSIKDILSLIHTHTINNYIHSDAPKIRSFEVIVFNDIINAYLNSNHFYFYDIVLEQKLVDFISSWNDSLKHGDYFVERSNSTDFIFPTPGDVFRNQIQEDAFEELEKARLVLYGTYTDFLSYVKANYIEIDLDETNRAALDFYNFNSIK